MNRPPNNPRPPCAQITIHHRPGWRALAPSQIATCRAHAQDMAHPILLCRHQDEQRWAIRHPGEIIAPAWTLIATFRPERAP